MKKWIVVISFVLAMVLIVTACSKEEQGAEEVNAASDVKKFTINAKNFEFDLQEMKVNKGDIVKVTLKNAEGNHAVKFEGYDEEVQGDKTISFVADKTGEFNYVCAVFCGAGHVKMVGKLIVE